MANIDFRKLKKDLLKKVGTSGIMPLIISIDTANEEKLIKLAEEYNFNISNYEKTNI